jgi:fission process protein 1
VIFKKSMTEKENSDQEYERYLAYASRLKTLLFKAERYVAYSSDIGESFRPIMSSNVVRASYAIAWGYIGYDVLREAQIARDSKKSEEEVREIVIKRAAFQSLASMVGTYC